MVSVLWNSHYSDMALLEELQLEPKRPAPRAMGWDQALDLYLRMKTRELDVIEETEESAKLCVFSHATEYYQEGCTRRKLVDEQERDDLLQELAMADFGAIEDEFELCQSPESEFLVQEKQIIDTLKSDEQFDVGETVTQEEVDQYMDVVTERSVCVHEDHIPPEYATVGFYCPCGVRTIASLNHVTYTQKSDQRLSAIDLSSKCALEDLWREIVRLRRGLSDRIATLEIAGMEIPVTMSDQAHKSFWIARDILRELANSEINTAFLNDSSNQEGVQYILLHAGITILLSDFRAGLVPVQDTANCVGRTGVWYVRDEWRVDPRVLYVDRFVSGRLPRFVHGRVRIHDTAQQLCAVKEAVSSSRNWLSWAYLDPDVLQTDGIGCSPSFNAVNGIMLLRTNQASSKTILRLLPFFRDANLRLIRHKKEYRKLSISRDFNLNRVSTRDMRLMNLYAHSLDLHKAIPLPVYRSDVTSVSTDDILLSPSDSE